MLVYVVCIVVLTRYLIIVRLIIIGNRLFTIRAFEFVFVLLVVCFWFNYVCSLVA